MTITQERALSFSGQQDEIRMEFGKPPVAETAVGFYFEKIEGWNILHHGALWERFKPKYPDCEFLPTILDTPPQLNNMFDLSNVPIRVGFVDKTKTQLVQTQNGLLIHNWRKRAENDRYQRYQTIRSQLQEDWNILNTYLHESSLKISKVTRCQVDYFNHLVRGEEWQDFTDLPKTFRVWRGLEQPVVGNLEMASFSVSYRVAGGTVHILVQPAVRTSDGKEVIQFTLSSSIAPTNPSDDDLFACLDKCHNYATQAFIDFTTEEARERWKQNK